MLILFLTLGCCGRSVGDDSDLSKTKDFIRAHCFDCHDSETQEGGLDLTVLPFGLGDSRNFGVWAKIHDRVRDGEMPPDDALPRSDTAPFVRRLANGLVVANQAGIKSDGRAVVRRMNRQEYEYTIRDLLDAPWLQLAARLPADGTAYGFNRSGEALDVARVQMARYLDAADHALRQVMAPEKIFPLDKRPQPSTTRYYARDQLPFLKTMNLGGPSMRHPFPILDGKGDHRFTELLKELNTNRKRYGRHKAVLQATSTPEEREREAIGVVVSTYEPTEIRFANFTAPVSGRYRLRLRAYSIWVAGETEWVGPDLKWGLMKREQRTRPDFRNVSRGRRDEPVTLYSDRSPRTLRKLGSFDVTPEPATHEMDAWLLAGETVRPDAARLFRLRGAHPINPLAVKDDGMPGVAFQWLEVEGPIYDQWPPAGMRLLFGDEISAQGSGATGGSSSNQGLGGGMTVSPEFLIRRFLERAYRHPVVDADVDRFVNLVDSLRGDGATFSEAMLGGYKAILCSPAFLYLREQPGRLDDHALACRLSYFLVNSAPDETLRQLARQGKLGGPDALRTQTERLLNQPQSRRFIDSLTDYWLDLRHLGDTAPDGSLYPDYQLDDLLVESMAEETRSFVSHLVAHDLPARNLVASNFTMLNERMASHYGIENVDGVHFRKVALPAGSSRGGLMTQSSVLKVTSDGTTTSPVIRGAWIANKVLGRPVPPPPESVPAVEPDTRGVSTIREILAKHRQAESCANCHRAMDPYGFALEGFDVMGAERSQYRAVGGTPIQGAGHNGRPFEFHYSLAAETHGELPGGDEFADVRELKRLLAEDDHPIAQNFLERLIVYATGAPVGFSDRDELNEMLSRARVTQFGIRTLIHEVVQSDMFQSK